MMKTRKKIKRGTQNDGAPKAPEHLVKYQKLFDEHMKFVDKLAQIITSGHLIIESALDNILETMIMHPEYLREARLSFSQKMQIARGLALNKTHLSPWALISSINAVRNEISHNLAGTRRTKKIEQLRRLYLSGAQPKFRERLKDEPDEVIAYFACQQCVGFLGTMEYDMKALREHIDTLAAVVKEGRETEQKMRT